MFENGIREFTPIELGKKLGVTNKTVINRVAGLVQHGFLIPVLVNERIRSYQISELTKENEEEIIKLQHGLQTKKA